jgi:lipid-binding SYLF domain-containing protein
MRFGRFIAAPLLALAFATAATGKDMSAEDKAKGRASVDKMEKETLARLYKAQPSAKKTVEGAAGYAVFSNFGIKIFVAGSGSGGGVAVKGGKRTYMKMIEVQAGLGIGVKKFRLVWVFENAGAFDKFVNSGMEIGAQASAAATDGAKGAAYQGAVAVSDGVWLYQLTDKGVAAELTAKGTKYYKDKDLN